jgi:acetolactate synthase-1/2/3 large subunit
MQRLITHAAGKATVIVEDNDVVGAVQRSLDLVLRRPRGSVTLDVPAGTWDNAAAVRPVVQPQFAEHAFDPTILGELHEALDRAQRPLLFVGGGALAVADGATGVAPLLGLAETLQAPILTSHQGKAIANWDHPLYLGPWASEPSVRDLCAEADVALVLGSKLSALGTGYHQLRLPEDTWLIGPDSSAHARYPHIQRIDADAREAASQLAASVKPKDGWAGNRIAEVRQSVRDATADRAGLELGFLAAITDSTSAPRLISADMCKAGFWIMKHLPVKPGGVHAFSSYLTMGTALPMAIGVSLARNEACLAVVGDGGLQMSLAELATLAELRAPVVVMVGVDGAYGMLRDNSAAVGGSTDLGLSLWNPDFRQLAHAYGIDAEDIASPADLTSALSRPTTGPRLLLVSTPFNRNW